MHDTESETIVLKTWPEKLSEMLKEFGIESVPKDVGSLDIEKGDYYSRYYPNSPRMITNLGCLEVKGTNIDLIQIIQKG